MLGVNKIQIPRPAQLIQISILTISYTRRPTLNLETIHSPQISARYRTQIRNSNWELECASVRFFSVPSVTYRWRDTRAAIFHFHFTVLIRLDERYVGSLLKAGAHGIKEDGPKDSHIRQSLDNQVKQRPQSSEPAQVAMVAEPNIAAWRRLSQINAVYAGRIVAEHAGEHR